MRAIGLWLFIVAVLPRVEDPWPDAIGIELPFAFAGAGGVLGSVRYAETTEAEQDQGIRKGGLFGFRVGAGVYVLSLLNQITFGL